MKVEGHDPHWAELFEAERARLSDALAPWLTAEGIEHVGSTSVPGLPAKPIIDMVAGVRSLAEARDAFPVLEAAGYTWRPHRPEAHLFVREGYGVHLTEPYSDLWRERLAFRDALLRSAALRTEYAAWKEEHFVGAGDSFYDANKRPLVERVLEAYGLELKVDTERLDPAALAARSQGV